MESEIPVKHPWLIAIVTLAAAASAPAQIGIYGSFDGTHLTNSSSSTFETPGWYYGGGLGIYDDFAHFGPVGLGADLRGNLLSGNGQKYRSGLIGLRLAVKPPLLPIRPYVQGSIGVGGPTHSGLQGSGTIYDNKSQYQVVGGVDFTFLPHLDWRVAEFGYGRLTGISSGGVAPASNLFLIGTGLVVRLP
jgi:hypothetical protein